MHLIEQTPTSPPLLLVTAAGAAGMLSMGKSTFWREVKLQHLPAPVKIGSLTRWRVADLERHINDLRPAPCPPPSSSRHEAL